MTAVFRRCEGSGTRLTIGVAVWSCDGCGITVRWTNDPTHTEHLIRRHVIVPAYRPGRHVRIPDHDRVDLVTMIRAGTFGPFTGQLSLLDGAA